MTPAINWPKRCTEVIADCYFRREGEVAGDYVIGNLYAAGINVETALQSAINETALVQASGVDQNLVSASAGQGDATTGVWTSEIAEAMKEWETARMLKTTDMTFEDWCEQFGVKMPTAQLFKPELIRYSREWTYPSNTISPTDGAPTAAYSWAISGRADKNRRFDEPGFIVGVMVLRPKVFCVNMNSHMTMLMNDAYTWLPPTLANDPWASFKRLAASDTPLDANTAAYYVDVKDIFLHGDQFIAATSFPTAGSRTPLVALPNAALTNKRYPASTDVDTLFVTQTAGTGKYRADGICTLHILGRQVETSPSSVGTNKTV
jgi:hypothetical protein